MEISAGIRYNEHGIENYVWGGISMSFTFAHNTFNVADLDESLAFYREALGLTETR